MKIKELLKTLKQYDPELDIVVQCSDRECYGLMDFATEGYCHEGNFTEVDSGKNVNVLKLEVDC